MTKRVLIIVTHLLGAGHLTRAAALARAFAEAGHQTTLISGGMPMRLPRFDNVSLVQLPPVRIQGTRFSDLLDAAGDPITPALGQARLETGIATLRRVKPDILITELFPFGRRVLAEEFLGLLREARSLRPRPLVLASVRDILVAPEKPERVAETARRIAAFYDAVLVHGDPALAPLDLSWPVDDRLRPLLKYTGYVDEHSAVLAPRERAGIVVSGGSSDASLPLYRAAIAAAKTIGDRPWRILVGRGVAEDAFQSLRAQCPDHVSIERARPDFRALLAEAALSVSQAGYNTSVDILRSGVKAVLVPFEAGKETEQRLRAERLQAHGLARILPECDLSAPALASVVRRALAEPSRPAPPIALDGAGRSVAIAEEMALSRPALLTAAIDWGPVETAIDFARDRGREPVLWWRDDDAVADSPQLDRLLQFSNDFGAPVAIAAIPRLVEDSLARRLQKEDRAFVLVHGSSHINHAPMGEKKAEFGAHRDVAILAQESAEGLRILADAFGPRFVPVFVPPWNRIAPALLPYLAPAGYVGVSTFRDRKAPSPAPGLWQINTHLDPIDWRGARGLSDVAALVTALAGLIRGRASGQRNGEPVGLLTHHLAHDGATWDFCEDLLAFLARKELHFAPVSKLFWHKAETHIAT